MRHWSAFGIDIDKRLTAVLRVARHRKAEWVGLDWLLLMGRLGLRYIRESTMTFALIPVGMAVAIAFVGVQKSPVAEGIDEELNGDSIVVVYRFQGDPELVTDQIAALNSIRSRFGQSAYVGYCRSRQDTRARRKIPVGDLLTLFVMTNHSSGRFVIHHIFEGPLGADMVEAVILQVFAEGADT